MVILFIGSFLHFYLIPRSNAEASNLNGQSGFHIKTKSTCLLGFEAFASAYRRQRHSAMFAKPKSFIVLNLILLCGDINVNPGPNWKYPCGICKKPVKSNQRGIQCGSCDVWIQTRCLGMNNDEYQLLATLHARGFVLIATFPILHLRFWTCPRIL